MIGRSRGEVMAIGVAALLVALGPRLGSATTLEEVLRHRGLTTAAQGVPNLQKGIAGYEVFDDGKFILIAYYVADNSGRLKGPLFISRLDKPARTWRHAEIHRQDARVGPVDCLGPVTAVRSSADAFYVGTHRNPSAGCTIVLAHDLALRTVLYGWFLRAFGDGTVVFHKSQVHFAPTHSAEVSMYSPRRGTTMQIYPMKPYQRIRTDHMERVRVAFRDEAWCRQRNHHCDPERFDDHLFGDVEISDASDALAFVVRFDNTVYWTERDRWRLEGFRELRKHLTGRSPGPTLADELFASLYADLARMRNLGAEQKVLAAFTGDATMHDLLRRTFAGARPAGQSPRTFFGTLDPRWEDPVIWQRLMRAVARPAEFTEVAYIYRHVTSGGPIEYSEILLSDLKARFGDLPLRMLLESPFIDQIFAP